VSDTVLSSTPELQEWSTCRGLEADSASAETKTQNKSKNTPFDFLFTMATPDGERFGVDRFGTKGGFTLGDRERNTNVGACSRLVPGTKNLLNLFYQDTKAALNEAWTLGSADMHQARALDELFAGFEVGRIEPPDLLLTHTQTKLQSKSQFSIPGSGYPAIEPDGIVSTFTTDAALQPAFQVIPPFQTWVDTDTHPLEATFSENGRSDSGTPFDAAYVVTTNAFNQFIRERSGTSLLWFQVQPTWADLGLGGGPNGEPADQIAPLTGDLLGQQVHGIFAQLGPFPVTITAKPTLLPFTWTPIDQPPPPFPSFDVDDAPVTYQLAQFVVDVVYTDPADPTVQRSAMSLAIDMFEDSFQITPGAPQTRVLDVAYSNDQWSSYILTMGLPTCPLVPHTAPQQGLPVCEGEVTAAINTLVRPILQQNLLHLVSGFPAPLQFTVPSVTSDPLLGFDYLESFTRGQRIMFYGNLIRP
jgi:hypothetical protein